MKKAAVLLSIVLYALSAPTATADTIHVNASGTGDYPTIQAAIDAATDGDEVVLAMGTYTGSGNRDIDFGPKAITVRSTEPNNPATVAATIIDCQGSETSMHRAFYIHHKPVQRQVLAGLTMINGYSPNGGAIYCYYTESLIKNCVIQNCTAESTGPTSEGYGGGIYTPGGIEIRGCIINSNTSQEEGTGIYCGGGSLVIDCEIKNNSSQHSEGGVYSDNHTVLLGCTISNNHGIAVKGNFDTISDCVIEGNSGLGFSGSGTVHNCTIRKNRGGLLLTGGTVSHCRIEDNITTDGGAGIYIKENNVSIINCLIRNNKSLGDGQGGGIICGNRVYSDIVNCLIYNNEASRYGGGISAGFLSDPKVTNSIVWGNKAPDGSQVALWSASLTVSYCNIQGGSDAVYVGVDCTLNWGDGMLDTDPGFAFENDFHLADDSACIDSGTNEPEGGLPGVDMDGNPRPFDGNSDANEVADIGIYEFNTDYPTIAVSAKEVEFFVSADGTGTIDKILQIRNAGGGTLEWDIIEACPWLEIIPASGTSTGQINNVTVRADITALGHGDHICTLSVVDEEAINSPQEVTIIVHANKTLLVLQQHSNIQAAIDVAIDGDTVLVEDGTHTGSGNRDIDFKGKAITVRSENGPENCVVNCQNNGNGFNFETFETPSSVLDGFTIANADDGGTHGYGIRSHANSSPTITNCIIKNCDRYGIFCSGDFTITNCTIMGIGGALSGYCNGIICYSGTGTISECTITACDGAGISLGRASPTISNCTLIGNTHGISCGVNSDAVIDNCTIKGNFSSPSFRHGAGITMANCNTLIKNTIISDNHAEGFAGGVLVWQENNDVTLANCLISGNTALEGAGGILASGGELTLRNCVIVGNQANTVGGGVLCAGTDKPVEIDNSIIWDNRAAQGQQIALWYEDEYYPCDLSIQFSDVQGGLYNVHVDPDCELNWGPGNLDSDPLFGDPGSWSTNNTPDPNDDYWIDVDYHLKSQAGRWDPNGPSWVIDPVTSPCIDTGNPGCPLGEEPADPANVRINMGMHGGTAYASKTPLDWGRLTDLTNDGITDLSDLIAVACYWLETGECIGGDLNRDQTVDWADFARLAQDCESWIYGTLDVALTLSNSWMYQNLHAQTLSNLTADVSITADQYNNTSYTYDWEFILPDDVSIAPAIIDGGGVADPCCTFAAPGCDEPNGLSDSGQALTVKVTVTGADFGNSAQAEVQFGIALLGDVNNDGIVNVTDRIIMNAYWRTGSAEPFTFRDCDINCDGHVNIIDRIIANAIWQGKLGSDSVTTPCPLR